MLASIVRFTDDSAGLEKTLRLLQGFCTLAVGFAQSVDDAEFYVKARSQFALGRRYFRFFKWYPCFNNAFVALNAASGREPSWMTALQLVKWTLLGGYFLLEMLTISNALGVTSYEWGPKVQREANRSWFFSLIASIVVSLCQLWLPPVVNDKKPSKKADGTSISTEKLDSSVEEKQRGKVAAADPAAANAKNKIYVQLAIDSCDIFIPGAAVGFVPVGPIWVGTASTISTLLAGRQIWDRVQAQGHKA